MPDAADQLTTLMTIRLNLTLTYNRDGDPVTQVDSASGTTLGYGYDPAVNWSDHAVPREHSWRDTDAGASQCRSLIEPN